MNLSRACCCSECECTGCGFASSYYAAGASVSGSWNYNSKFNPCTHFPCGSQEEDLQIDVDVVLTITFGGGVITRNGSVACCYSRTGNATVAYSVTITSSGKCCFGGSACTDTKIISGSKTVTYKHTVVPICLAGKACAWAHSIGLCAFEIGVHDWWMEINPEDCPLNCDELPYVRNGFIINGCALRWNTPYQALDTLVYGDFSFLGYCGPVYSCAAVDPSVGLQWQHPFSVLTVPDWGSSPPGDCPTVTATPLFWFDSGEYPGYSPCSGDAELDAQCYSREFHFNAMPPLYT